jgi:hypothetical protein
VWDLVAASDAGSGVPSGETEEMGAGGEQKRGIGGGATGRYFLKTILDDVGRGSGRCMGQ